MNTHTPGPWRYSRSDMMTYVDGVRSKWIYSADDQYVAVASGRIAGEWDEVMANARLIAASPAMLEALYTIGSILSRDDLDPDLVESAYRAAVDAIELATKEPTP